MKSGSGKAYRTVNGRSPEADLTLAQSAANGDERAQRIVIDLVFDRVRRTISYLVGGGDEVQDLTQHALLEILRSLESFRAQCPLERWADRVAVRTTAKQVRKTIRRRRLRAEERYLPVDSASVDETVALGRVCERISALLVELSYDKRIVLVLRYLHGYDVSEVAAIVDAKINTVRGRLRAARKWMRQRAYDDPVLRQWIEGGSDET